MNGRIAEEIMFWILNLCNFLNKEVTFTNHQLLTIAGEFTTKWENFYSKKMNRKENWKHRNQTYILDTVYKLDRIVESCGQLYGLQLTLNEEALNRKRKQTVERQELYKKLGLRAVIIVFVVPGEAEGTAFWTPDQLENTKMQTYDCIIAAEDNLEVGNYITNYTINLP